jgi:twitching motility protein PilI
MAKRISLREFQRDLSERLLSARRGDSSESLLGIKSGTEDTTGGDHWLIDLFDSGEVVPLPGLTSVPLTHSWFAGIANIRGTLYSVVDFSAWRGGPSTPRNPEARLLLIGARHGINTALLVSRALGLRPRSQMTAIESTDRPKVDARDTATTGVAGVAGIDDTSETPPETPWFGGRYTDPNGMIWTQLRIPALLATPNYLDIAR